MRTWGLAEKEYDDCRMATTVRISRALTAQAALDMLVQSHSEIAISLRPAPFHDEIVAATRYIDDTLYIDYRNIDMSVLLVVDIPAARCVPVLPCTPALSRFIRFRHRFSSLFFMLMQTWLNARQHTLSRIRS